MAKVILISCASKKLPCKSKARYLYTSPLFKHGLRYADSLNPDKIFILSAKYGLLNPDAEIEPYNETLNDMEEEKIKKWAEKIILDLKEKTDLENDEFIFLAGSKYRKFLIPYIRNHKAPLENLGIGKQLKYLKDNLNQKNFCNEIHALLNSMKRFSFPFDEDEIPLNGIYILFEKNENAHGKDRIVRVGTHTGENQLRARLRQHFIDENKDRSIFRNHIGRAFLNKDEDYTFLDLWKLNLTSKKAKEEHLHKIDFKKKKETEKRVTEYMQKNFSFIFFEVKEESKRKEFERKIIGTVSLCNDCKSSNNWLGKFSPEKKIRESGLWNINELYKEPLSEKDYLDLVNIITTFKN